MRAVVTNFGSTGDILPYLALSVELHRHGHELVVAFPPYYTSLVEQFGLAFCPVGPDLREVQNNVIVGMQTVPDSIAHMRALFAPLAAALPQMYRELCDICRDADVLISGPSQPASRMVHETTGIPFVSSQENHFGGGGTLAFQQASASLVNPFRAQLGLPPIRNPDIGDAN
jgi:sterol 3beta-glucosyltransferase